MQCTLVTATENSVHHLSMLSYLDTLYQMHRSQALRMLQMMDCDNIMNKWQNCLEKLNLSNELGRNAASKDHERNYTHKE